jgi:1-acyl-sn-glycerol-3-phosphate acyltransferase
MIVKVLRFIFTIYGFLVFLLLMFLLMPFFLLAFSMETIKGGNLIYKLAGLWADILFFMVGIRSKIIYEATPDPTGHYIFVSNHISYLDIPMMVKVIRKQPVRILGKAETAKVPVFGNIYKRGAVLVDRSDPQKRSESVQNLIRFVQKGISVFICPEGTFNKTHRPLKNFYDGAFRIAIETQTPIRPILFLDTYDRLHYMNFFSLTPGICRAVFLQEIPVDQMTIGDLPQLKEAVYTKMEDKLIQYQADWIR